MLDLRKWFIASDRPTSHDLNTPTNHFPCSDFRSESVMRVFLAGFETGFKLTNANAQPTEALRVLVAEMRDVKLFTGDELRPEEQRVYMPKGTSMEQMRKQWFLRCGARFRANAPATMSYGWAWNMLPGFKPKRLVETNVIGHKSRTQRWIVVIQPNWELSDNVYYGLTFYRGDKPRKDRDTYAILASCLAAGCGPGGGIERGAAGEASSAAGPQLPPAVGCLE